LRAAVVCLALTLAFAAREARAHGDVHQRIEALDRLLAAEGLDAAPLMERGTLYAVDQDWPAAVRDLEAARDLDPALPGLDERLAKALLQVGEAERAALELEAVLAHDPTSADARLVRARALADLGRIDEADAEFGRAIELAAKPSPRMYLDRAVALLEATPARADAALAALESGVARLGALVFVERAQEIELSRGRAAEALAWTDRLPDDVKAAPDWRLRRAKIHDAAGDRSAARRELEAALSALDALPPSRGGAEALQALRTEILVFQASLEDAEPARSPTSWGWAAAGVATALGAALLLRSRARPGRAR
jgi:tetratricopeptide (TPR) repeat protein